MDDKKVILVTGANRGIGLKVAQKLLEYGDVIITARDIEKVKKASAGFKHPTNKLYCHQLDVLRLESIKNTVEFIDTTFGRLDVLINNAGIYKDEKYRLLDLDEAILAETLNVNLMGAFRIIKKVIPLMVKHQYGRIVNVSSGFGAISSMNGYSGAYKLSKLALNGMTKILADELDPSMIKINAVCPGWVRTDMGGKAASRSIDEGAKGIVDMALIGEDSPSGGFYRDGQVIEF